MTSSTSLILTDLLQLDEIDKFVATIEIIGIYLFFLSFQLGGFGCALYAKTGI